MPKPKRRQSSPENAPQAPRDPMAVYVAAEKIGNIAAELLLNAIEIQHGKNKDGLSREEINRESALARMHTPIVMHAAKLLGLDPRPLAQIMVDDRIWEYPDQPEDCRLLKRASDLADAVRDQAIVWCGEAGIDIPKALKAPVHTLAAFQGWLGNQIDQIRRHMDNLAYTLAGNEILDSQQSWEGSERIIEAAIRIAQALRVDYSRIGYTIGAGEVSFEKARQVLGLLDAEVARALAARPFHESPSAEKSQPLEALTPDEEALLGVLTHEGQTGPDLVARLRREGYTNFDEPKISNLCKRPAMKARGVRNRRGAGYYIENQPIQ